MAENELLDDDGNHSPKRVQSTYIVECRVSILGIGIMIWESIPIKKYLGSLGSRKVMHTVVELHRGQADVTFWRVVEHESHEGIAKPPETPPETR